MLGCAVLSLFKFFRPWSPDWPTIAMLDPGEVAQARLGLTPAKAPPKNFKNAENLEFFEVSAGNYRIVCHLF